jgi:hypothetical protein
MRSATMIALRSQARRLRGEFVRARVLGDGIRRVAACMSPLAISCDGILVWVPLSGSRYRGTREPSARLTTRGQILGDRVTLCARP